MTRIKFQSTNKQVVVCWSYMEWKRVIYRWVTKGWNVTNDFLKGRGWEGQCWNFCLPTSDPPWFTFPHAFSYKNTWTAQNHGIVASKGKLDLSYLTLFSANLALHSAIILASGQTASLEHFLWWEILSTFSGITGHTGTKFFILSWTLPPGIWLS